MARTTAEAERIVDEYANAWNDHDFSKVSDLVSESIVVRNPNLPGGKLEGMDAYRGWFEEVTTGFPDFEVIIHETLARDDVVMSEVTYSMTHDGEFNGIPATGEHFEQRAMASFRVDGDKIVEHRDYIDRLETFEQLGLLEGVDLPG